MANSAPLNIAQAAGIVDKSIQHYWLKSSDPEVQYKNYFNYRTTEDYYDKDQGLSGLSEASFTDENASIIADVPIQTNLKTYTQTQVDALVSFTWMMSFGITKQQCFEVNSSNSGNIL